MTPQQADAQVADIITRLECAKENMGGRFQMDTWAKDLEALLALRAEVERLTQQVEGCKWIAKADGIRADRAEIALANAIIVGTTSINAMTEQLEAAEAHVARLREQIISTAWVRQTETQ